MLRLADAGGPERVAGEPLAIGYNVVRGRLLNAAVAEAHGLEATPMGEALASLPT